MKKILLVVLVVAFAVASSSCASYYQAKRGEMGGLITSSCALQAFIPEKPGIRDAATFPYCGYDGGIRISVNTNQMH